MSNENQDKPSISIFGQSLAAVASPIVLFYTGGCLLSLGYFQPIGPSLLTAFSPTELALAGFARIANVAVALAVIAVLLTLLALALARLIPARSASMIGDRFLGILCVADALMIAGGIFSMGIYPGLLGLLASLLTMAIGIVLIMNWREWARPAARRLAYLSAPIVLILGLLAIGEGSYLVALNPETAQTIIVPVGKETRPATLLALGAGAMIYRLDGCLYLAGPRGDGALEVGCQPMPKPVEDRGKVRHGGPSPKSIASFSCREGSADARKRAPGSISAYAPTKPLRVLAADAVTIPSAGAWGRGVPLPLA